MKLKKDWSLEYLMYYLFRISFWTYLIMIFTQIVLPTYIFRNEDSIMTLEPIPVLLNIEQLSSYNDIKNENLTINIKDNAIGSVYIKANLKHHLPELLYYTGIQFFNIIILLMVLHYGSKLLKNVALGDPFNDQNPTYLFTVGWVMFLGSIVFMIISYLPLPLFDSLQLPEGVIVKSIAIDDRGFMASGILAIVFGYVFKEGTRLYEEQKLTV